MNLIIEVQHPEGHIVSRTRWTWTGFTHQACLPSGAWEDGTWIEHRSRRWWAGGEPEDDEPICRRDHVKKMIAQWIGYWEGKDHKVFASLDGRKVI